MATLKFGELLSDEELEVKDLPKEIQNKVSGLKLLVGKFNKLCDKEDKTDKEKEDEAKLEKSINEKDMLLCDSISEYLKAKVKDDNTETDETDETATDEDAKDEFEKIENEAVEAEKKKKEEKEAQEQKDKEEKEQKEKDEKAKQASLKGKYPFGTAEMEQEIMSNVKNGVIQVSILEKILGREPNYPREKIFNIVLEKVLYRNEYRVK